MNDDTDLKFGKPGVILAINNPFKLDSETTQNFFRAGVIVVAADNEYDVTWYIRAGQYDLCLFDIALRGDEGMRILKWIKYDKTTKHMPIVIFSENADEKMIEEAKKIGALDFKLNPKSAPKELAEQIKDIWNKFKK